MARDVTQAHRKRPSDSPKSQGTAKKQRPQVASSTSSFVATDRATRHDQTPVNRNKDNKGKGPQAPYKNRPTRQSTTPVYQVDPDCDSDSDDEYAPEHSDASAHEEDYELRASESPQPDSPPPPPQKPSKKTPLVAPAMAPPKAPAKASTIPSTRAPKQAAVSRTAPPTKGTPATKSSGAQKSLTTTTNPSGAPASDPVPPSSLVPSSSTSNPTTTALPAAPAKLKLTKPIIASIAKLAMAIPVADGKVIEKVAAMQLESVKTQNSTLATAERLLSKGWTPSQILQLAGLSLADPDK
ncbi:hypothetical protein BOTBODRAFT_168719 [Botryobasidium botryosum FD-172 SS1]|uniref:Uncharacterized protein n=1 Tax=Botryobasidium botryosum (strain FD-172 SS1) TaxID=930990 RepID=A0A067NCF5_BOTB1|nr:hypothetical protein BOTBODRAFT_168719 [Botryobasidium botryosum FD-172 SS1]